MRVALHLCLWLPAALTLHVPRRTVILGPPAAALVAEKTGKPVLTTPETSVMKLKTMLD